LIVPVVAQNPLKSGCGRFPLVYWRNGCDTTRNARQEITVLVDDARHIRIDFEAISIGS